MTVNIDRVTGKAKVNIPPFEPTKKVSAPDGSSHFQIVAAAAEVDFANNTYNVVASESDNILLGINPTQEIDLECDLTANGTLPLFLVVGIDFSQEVNGGYYPLKNGNFNALSFVKVLGS